METGVLAVVGARLNSSRLPRKHLLDLCGQPVIARLFQRLEAVPEISEIVLATTHDAYNQPLLDWAHAHQKQAFAYDGDVNDLVGRVDAVVRPRSPGIVLYVCGDSPLIEPTTLSALIKQLAAHPNACMALLKARGGPPIHEGFDVYRRSFWQKMVEASKQPHEREHVGASLRSQWSQLPMAYVTDEPIFYALKHRLSVDTPSDYRFMSEVYRRWYAQNPPDSIVSLPWVIRKLLEDEHLRSMNALVRQKTVTQKSTKVLLVLRQGAAVGLGHLARMLPLAKALQDRQSAGVSLLIEGPPLQRPDLGLLPHWFCDDLVVELPRTAPGFDTVVVDIPPKTMNPELLAVMTQIAGQQKLVSIDFSVPVPPAIFNWVPSFYLKPELLESGRNLYGWDRFLLARPSQNRTWAPGIDLCVLTGGSDAFGLGAVWPELLDAQLPDHIHIHWIRGPYAPPPALPQNLQRHWEVHHNPDDMGALLGRCAYVLTVYGVSLFECLIRGLPSVTLATPNQIPEEMEHLNDTGATIVAETPQEAVARLVALINDSKSCKKLSQKALDKIDGQGSERMAAELMK